MRLIAKALVTACMITAFGSSTVTAAVVDIYDGFEGGTYVYPTLSSYFSGQGYTVNQLTASFTSLAGANLAILSDPEGFGSAQLSAIDSYVNGGGRLIINSDGTGFEGAQTGVNNILTSLGSSIVNVDAGYDVGYHNTTNVVSGPFTAGVTSINYGYTSYLTGGTPVAYGISGQLFIADQQIGAGYVFAIADFNTADSTTFTGDNPTLYCDFGGLSCGSSVSTTPLPAALPLFASGLGVIGLFGWRKKRKNAAAIVAA
jgi:hypothetical protein